MRDLSVFAGWFGLPNDEFLLSWRSISQRNSPAGWTRRRQDWSAPMVITVFVQGYDIADVRPVFGKGTE